jgi:YVTN family beta-propeller protein
MDIVVDAAGARLYTANHVSGDTVIDAQTMAVVDTIDLPGKPSAITTFSKAPKLPNCAAIAWINWPGAMRCASSPRAGLRSRAVWRP